MEEKEKEETIHQTNSDRAKRYNFHHVSVSVPIDIPTLPGEVMQGHIPFGPPVIHEDPSKTQHLHQESRLFTDNNGAENFSFFDISGPRITPVFNEIEMEDQL